MNPRGNLQVGVSKPVFLPDQSSPLYYPKAGSEFTQLIPGSEVSPLVSKEDDAALSLLPEESIQPSLAPNPMSSLPVLPKSIFGGGIAVVPNTQHLRYSTRPQGHNTKGSLRARSLGIGLIKWQI